MYRLLLGGVDMYRLLLGGVDMYRLWLGGVDMYRLLVGRDVRYGLFPVGVDMYRHCIGALVHAFLPDRKDDRYLLWNLLKTIRVQNRRSICVHAFTTITDKGPYS